MHSCLEVNIPNIINNIKFLQKNKKACLVVKANAYGVGLEVVDYMVKYGYDFFAVSTLEEVKQIRLKHPDINILKFGAVFEEELEEARQNNTIFTLHDFDFIKQLKKDDRFHIKIDIGMGRLGFQEKQIQKLIDTLLQKDLKPEGIYTHFPASDNEEQTLKQIQKFEQIVKRFQQHFDFKYISMDNGVASFKYNTNFDNMVRPGLAMYGYVGDEKTYQDNKHLLQDKLKPALKLKVKVAQVKDYQGPIGYDSIDTVQGQIITVPLGYHDGIYRTYQKLKIKNVGQIVGKICTCQMMIKLNENTSFKKGDWIYLWDDNTTLYDVANHTQQTVYELILGLSNRINRQYNEQ